MKKLLQKTVTAALAASMLVGAGFAVQAAPTYVMDASGIAQIVQTGDFRLSTPADTSITDNPSQWGTGVVIDIAPGAAHADFDWILTGGGMRSGGDDGDGLGWFDPNGANRELTTNVQFTGPIRIDVTGDSWNSDSNSPAVFHVTFGDETVVLELPRREHRTNVDETRNPMETVSHVFETGTGYLSISHWPWDGGGRENTATQENLGRLAVQRIAVWENYAAAAVAPEAPAAPVAPETPAAPVAPAVTAPANVPATNDNATIIYALGASFLLAAAVAVVVYKKRAIQ